MNKQNRKTMILLVSIAVMLVVVVGTTIAYLTTSTGPVKNTFLPTEVTTEITEGFDSKVKNNVMVKNTGDIDAYIRATVIVTWKDAAGQVYATAPVENTDYKVTWTKTDWVEGSDGYYYYTKVVELGASTGVLLTNCAPIAGRTPEGYHLSVEILASAIQAEPSDAVETAWGVTVANDGTISKN